LYEKKFFPHSRLEVTEWQATSKVKVESFFHRKYSFVENLVHNVNTGLVR